MTRLTWTLAAAGIGALAALWMTARSLASPPEWSLRTNVSGKQVPAVLGVAVVFGGAIAMAAVHVAAVLGWVDRNGEVDSAALIVFLVMGAAGTWDDRRGDESPRGFGGHLRAGRLTGGLVKIAAGGVAGLAAGLIVYPDRLVLAGLTTLAVPLAANLFNLFDRAPGRSGKVALVVAVPLLAIGHVDWALAAAGPFGALAAVLPSDLGERGMLGDAGANPLGALAGLGLAVSLGTWALTAVVIVLLLLNAASERWSFSAIIEKTPLLRRLDSMGRK